MPQSKCVAILSAVLGTIVINATAQGEWVLSIYGGKSITENGDLELHQSERTSLTFEDVSWDDHSFESPLYYGARPSYWLDKWPGWGASLDFTHAKMYLDPNDTVHVIGTRLGMAVNEPERIGATIQRFSNSHGLNFLTLNLLHRWFPKGQRGDSPLGRLQPYVGIGAGITIPHVETTVDNKSTDEYQFGGPALQGLAGLSYDLFKHLSTFIEYKISYADVDMDIAGGGKISIEPVTHQFVFGLSARF
jgi:lipid A oxidase